MSNTHAHTALFLFDFPFPYFSKIKTKLKLNFIRCNIKYAFEWKHNGVNYLTLMLLNSSLSRPYCYVKAHFNPLAIKYTWNFKFARVQYWWNETTFSPLSLGIEFIVCFSVLNQQEPYANFRIHHYRQIEVKLTSSLSSSFRFISCKEIVFRI